MEYSKEITRVLYDNCGFVADNFFDSTKKGMFNELNVNRDEYNNLFSHFSCELRYEKGCYYLVRRNPTRQQVDSRLKDYFMWAEIIDLIHDVIGDKVKPGKTFTQGQFLDVVEKSLTLPRKIQSLSVFLRENIKAADTAEYVKGLIGFLVKKQVLDPFTWEQDDTVTVYQLTSVFDFFQEFVIGITLRKKEEENIIDEEN